MQSTMPAASEVALRPLLERNAEEAPDRLAVSFEDDLTWTTAQALSESYRAANTLLEAGVRQGDPVAVFLPNGPDFVRAWWGIACLGAVIVPLNTAWKGALLSHALKVTSPVVVVTDDEGAARLAASGETCNIVMGSTLGNGSTSPPPLDRPIEVWDTHNLQFTSGTTGPSKASRNSVLQLFLTGSWATADIGVDDSDVFLIDLPLFHQGAMCMAACCQATRTPIVVRATPAMTRYWEVAKETGATIAFLLSSMVDFLQGRDPSASDRDHAIRLMLASPLPADPTSFMERFGIESIITAYGSTEVSGPLVTRPGEPIVRHTCGRQRPGWELRIVDDHDIEVPVGQIGELIVRTDRPWSLSSGYVGDPAATASAWRNGWFHTGDLLWRDADGNYFFVDRTKDALRRRGENISSYEVEAELLTHPAIAEVACVAVRHEDLTDDEVKVWIVPKEGAALDLSDLVRYLVDRMPHYMVPRYYEVTDALPKTTTMKIQKQELRDRGNSSTTWDMEDHGLRVTRKGLVSIEDARERQTQ